MSTAAKQSAAAVTVGAIVAVVVVMAGATVGAALADHDKQEQQYSHVPQVTPYEGFTIWATARGMRPVPQSLADALAEGDDSPPEMADIRDWEQCFLQPGDTTLIICPDGFWTTS